MAEREQLIADFLDRAGWEDADRSVLAADASFRRYDRLVRDGQSAVLMDAPPPQEDVRPFLRIAEHLIDLGFSAPQIFARDVEAGLLLLEDFGDNTFTRLLAGNDDEFALYQLATDTLIALHQLPGPAAIPDGLPPYDDATLLNEARLLTRWYFPAVRGDDIAEDAEQEYLDCWRQILPLARNVPDTLVLRDFHVDNLVRLDGRPGYQACGLLDFQDALAGPVTYDLVSLLEDARRDISEDVRTAMRQHYLDAFPTLDPDDLDRSFAILGAQRHAKVIGIFTRLCIRDGKDGYLHHIPRVWRLLERACRHPVLAPVAAWLDHNIPPAARVIPEIGGGR